MSDKPAEAQLHDPESNPVREKLRKLKAYVAPSLLTIGGVLGGSSPAGAVGVGVTISENANLPALPAAGLTALTIALASAGVYHLLKNGSVEPDADNALRPE